ncbi:preprotein translocase subunit SCY2, chloroplastic isoform X2 [Amaranthus tricolor]|uniref:preprotein translocase subunit SCY2, chloroplastic isoform X2 n=1 Tax=Amaranthus tricolor TaxID=29722 RepID=UPI00258D7367|nr:preprotein translocase subunit SCY2, chloroplastic isoform X2 [Amaranthus tricolor]
MAKLSLPVLHLHNGGPLDFKSFFSCRTIPNNFSQFKGGYFVPSITVRKISCTSTHVSVQHSQRHIIFSKVPLLFKVNRNSSLLPPQSGSQSAERMFIRSFSQEVPLSELQDGQGVSTPNSTVNDGDILREKRTFKNRFMNFVRFGSVINDTAESFFKSEIRRRLFVTAALLIASRVGYFIPLPGFDRRLIPQDYLSFVSGSADELGDYAPEVKMSLFQLGISPQIAASILMQILCHVVPSLVKLRKEGLDGHEKIKAYIWWISLGFAILEALIVACHSLQYSIYGASHRVKHVMVASLLMVCGAMTMTWICDKISEAGFGQGSSLVICVGILTSYTNILCKMLSQFSGSALSWSPYALGLLGIFMAVTMWAVVVTQGCRKIKLQYYGFKLASTARNESPITEVEPYIPFNINPSGMQPVLTTSYLLAVPSILASLLGSRFWEHVKEILNPETSVGAEPWVYYTIYAFFVFVFNIFDIK